MYVADPLYENFLGTRRVVYNALYKGVEEVAHTSLELLYSSPRITKLSFDTVLDLATSVTAVLDLIEEKVANISFPIASTVYDNSLNLVAYTMEKTTKNVDKLSTQVQFVIGEIYTVLPESGPYLDYFNQKSVNWINFLTKTPRNLDNSVPTTTDNLTDNVDNHPTTTDNIIEDPTPTDDNPISDLPVVKFILDVDKDIDPEKLSIISEIYKENQKTPEIILVPENPEPNTFFDSVYKMATKSLDFIKDKIQKDIAEIEAEKKIFFQGNHKFDLKKDLMAIFFNVLNDVQAMSVPSTSSSVPSSVEPPLTVLDVNNLIETFYSEQEPELLGKTLEQVKNIAYVYANNVKSKST